MANQAHLDILKQGAETWNRWRKEHVEVKPVLNGAFLSFTDLRRTDLRRADLREAFLSFADLSRADLRGATLNFADLSRADLRGADLRGADLRKVDFRKAFLKDADFRRAILSDTDLSGAHLNGANLSDADLSDTDLSGAYLNGANFSDVDLSRADLSRADLSGALLVRTNLKNASLTNCSIYGVAVWDVKLEETKQDNLVITPSRRMTISVDNLKIAQFIYLLLNNAEIREVIDTIAKKAVLILGRFTSERKAILDALKEALRTHGYLPILFDFDKPVSRDITETVSTLAHLARFVIADITDAKSIPQELMLIVPNLPSVPIQPLILNSQHEYGMFEHFTRFPWVLPVYRYTDEVNLLQSLQKKVISPAEKKVKELEKQ